MRHPMTLRALIATDAALVRVEPAQAGRTRVIARPRLRGCLPFVAGRDPAGSGRATGLAAPPTELAEIAEGPRALTRPQLDRMTAAGPSIHDGIRARMRDLAG